MSQSVVLLKNIFFCASSRIVSVFRVVLSSIASINIDTVCRNGITDNSSKKELVFYVFKCIVFCVWISIALQKKTPISD